MEHTAEEYERLWLLTNSLPQGAALIDSRGRLLFANEAFAKLTGARHEDLRYGAPFPDDRLDPKLSQFIYQALKSVENLELELVVMKNNQRSIFQAKSSHLESKKNQGSILLILFHDVTRVKHLEQMRQDFVSNVSHELRTPVTSIKGASETLQDGAIDNPADARKFSNIIFRQSERLSRIIEDLLSLSKIEKESDSNFIEFAEQDLYTIILAASRNYEGRAHDAGITLKIPIPQAIRLKANRTLLEQAVGNLIENAIEHSEKGTSVSLIIEQLQDSTSITVSDEGCGIAEEHLPRLFERFYRVDKSRSRKFGGTGLGLAIVKHVALAHKGEISVVSRPNEGSTFKITLPNLESV
jgi:two-component system phosphate regulon sensor histidine kinase PhoR